MNPVDDLLNWWKNYVSAQNQERNNLLDDLRQDEAHDCATRARVGRLVISQLEKLTEQLLLQAEPAPTAHARRVLETEARIQNLENQLEAWTQRQHEAATAP